MSWPNEDLVRRLTDYGRSACDVFSADIDPQRIDVYCDRCGRPYSEHLAKIAANEIEHLDNLLLETGEVG